MCTKFTQCNQQDIYTNPGLVGNPPDLQQFHRLFYHSQPARAYTISEIIQQNRLSAVFVLRCI